MFAASRENVKHRMMAVITALMGGTHLAAIIRLSFTHKRCNMTNALLGRKMRPLLFSLEVQAGAARSIVRNLHRFALESNLRKIGDIQHLVGKEVQPGRDDETDPLRRMKIDAMIKIKKGDRALAILPVEVLAFSCQLPNGQAMNIGLCRYPEEIQQPSSGEMVKVYDPDYWAWQSSVLTLAPMVGMETCLETHKAVVGLLRYAEDLGALQQVDDPTNFFRTRWERGLERACRDQCARCGTC